MPSTRAQVQTAIGFPKKKLARTPSKGLGSCRAPEPSGATLGPAPALPLSPRKRLGEHPHRAHVSGSSPRAG